jgi:hypothetical protein
VVRETGVARVAWEVIDGTGNSLVLCQSKTHSLRAGVHAVSSTIPFWVVGGESDLREENFLARESAERPVAPSERGPLAMQGR